MADTGVRKIHHFRNLPNGLTCGCPHLGSSQHVLRLQSSSCEQGLWGRVIQEAGAEVLYGLAIGDVVIVHDKTSVGVESRPCWQGLSWVRYATWREWNGPRGIVTVMPEHSRGGHPLNDFWEHKFLALDRRDRQFLRYFQQFYKPGHTIFLRSCWRIRNAAEANRRKHEERVAEPEKATTIVMPHGPYGPMVLPPD